MTIAEMQAWLEKVEPGETCNAVRQSFEVCLRSPEMANQLRAMISPLEASDTSAYLLALGHWLAIAAINQMYDENLVTFVNPVDKVKK